MPMPPASNKKYWRTSLLWIGVVVFVGSCVGAFWFGWRSGAIVHEGRARVVRLGDEDRFRVLGMALRFYHQAHGEFPPTKYQPEPDGPIHSWRVLLVPHTDGEGYSNYDFSQEWNSQHNIQALSDGFGAVYYRMSGGIKWAEGINDTATILAIGEGDEWPSDGPLRAFMVEEGKDRFLLVENPSSEIHWMEPKY